MRMIDPAPDDPLAAYRLRVMYPVAAIGAVANLPFAILNFVHGRHALGGLLLCVVLGFAADAFAIRLRKPPPVPFALLLVPIAAGITLSIQRQGVFGAFWRFPVVLFVSFVLSRPAANVCSATLLVLPTFMLYRYIGTAVAARFFVSLAMTIGVVNIILNVIRDLQLRLLAQSITDPLTGAFNRRYMEARLAESIEAGRRRGAAASLLMMDVDHFKTLNDRFGHEAGDAVLKALVVTVRARLRRLDLVFRLGGEEFIVPLPDTASGPPSTWRRPSAPGSSERVCTTTSR